MCCCICAYFFSFKINLCFFFYQIQKSNTPLTRVIMNLNAIWAMFHDEMHIQRVDIEVAKRKSSFHVT
jgi:hypothetical protein